MGSQRVGCDLGTKQQQCKEIVEPLRHFIEMKSTKWQETMVIFLEEEMGERQRWRLITSDIISICFILRVGAQYLIPYFLFFCF